MVKIETQEIFAKMRLPVTVVRIIVFKNDEVNLYVRWVTLDDGFVVVDQS